MRLAVCGHAVPGRSPQETARWKGHAALSQKTARPSQAAKLRAAGQARGEAIRVAAAARRKLARPPPLHNQLSLLSRGRYFALSSFRSLPRALCWNWRRPHVAAPPTQPRRSPSSSGLTLERRYPAAAQPTSAARTPRNGIATAANRTAAPAGAPVSPLRAQTGRQTDRQISITISNKFRTRLVSLTICE